MHSDLALRGEVDDEIGVFRGHGSRRNCCRKAESGVREAIVGIADGADQGGGSAEIGCCLRSGPAVTNGLAISGETKSAGGFLLVEDFVEQDDLACDFVTAQRL